MTTSQQEIEEQENGKGTQEPQNDNNYAPKFDQWVKEKPRHKYIRLELEVPTVLRFKSGRPNEMIMTDFGGKVSEKKPAARYMVSTTSEPNEQVAFDVTSKRLAAEIQYYCDKGFNELEITKRNTSPISYRVVPLMARERQQGLAPGKPQQQGS